MKRLSHFSLKHIAFIAMLLLLLNCEAQSQIITTIAGNGTGTYNGDGLPALQAQFLPEAIAADKFGNLFISDLTNSRVRKVDLNGIISTVAGNGIKDFTGDGGLAVNASLNYNWGIALDSALNLYIVDNGESRIRKVTTDGIINTIAGTDIVNGGGYNGDNILAINARLDHPSYVTVDAIGNIYISDQNPRIRKIDTNGVITTIAGNGVRGYSGDGGLAINAEMGNPFGIVVDKTGNVYFADVDNNVIRKIALNGIITTFAGNGSAGYTGDGALATSATLNQPIALAVGNDGSLFITDTYNHVVRKVDAAGIITTVAGDGSAGFSGDGSLAVNAKLNLPAGLAFDNGNNLLIADYGNARIRKVTFGTLPVTLTAFSAVNDNSKVRVDWQTTTEINASHFNVQRSEDGSVFTSIARITAKGIGSGLHSYQFVDVNAFENKNDVLYYRLQSVDKNGMSSYSKTLKVELNHAHSLVLYPNPASNSIRVKIQSDRNEKVMIQIIDSKGRPTRQLTVQLFTGLNKFVMDVATLAKGSYLLKVIGSTIKGRQFLKL